MPIGLTMTHLETVTHPEIAFEDARGLIINLVSGPILRHVAWIMSKAGAIRANHWHPAELRHPETNELLGTGDQWIYLLSGAYTTVACLVDADGKLHGTPETLEVRAGDLVYTPPGVAHAQYFSEDSTFLNIDGVTREHEGYGVKHTFPVKVPLIKNGTMEGADMLVTLWSVGRQGEPTYLWKAR